MANNYDPEAVFTGGCEYIEIVEILDGETTDDFDFDFSFDSLNTNGFRYNQDVSLAISAGNRMTVPIGGDQQNVIGNIDVKVSGIVVNGGDDDNIIVPGGDIVNGTDLNVNISLNEGWDLAVSTVGEVIALEPFGLEFDVASEDIDIPSFELSYSGERTTFYLIYMDPLAENPEWIILDNADCTQSSCLTDIDSFGLFSVVEVVDEQFVGCGEESLGGINPDLDNCNFDASIPFSVVSYCLDWFDSCDVCGGPGAIYECSGNNYVGNGGCDVLPENACDCDGSGPDYPEFETCIGYQQISCNYGDADNDGVCYGVDNCEGVENADQNDMDFDGFGNACDIFCMESFNLEEDDLNSDGIISEDECDAHILNVGDDLLPVDFMMYQNYPNPFNPSTTIAFDIPKSDNVSIAIFDISGRKINEIVNGYYSPGKYSIVWDGRDLYGKEVSSGLYIYQFISSDKTISKKLILLR